MFEVKIKARAHTSAMLNILETNDMYDEIAPIRLTKGYSREIFAGKGSPEKSAKKIRQKQPKSCELPEAKLSSTHQRRGERACKNDPINCDTISVCSGPLHYDVWRRIIRPRTLSEQIPRRA